MVTIGRACLRFVRDTCSAARRVRPRTDQIAAPPRRATFMSLCSRLASWTSPVGRRAGAPVTGRWARIRRAWLVGDLEGGGERATGVPSDILTVRAFFADGVAGRRSPHWWGGTG